MHKKAKTLYCKKHGIIIDTSNTGYEWQEKYNDILNFLIEKRKFPRNSGVGAEYELNKYYTAHFELHKEGVMSEKQKSYFEKIDTVGKIIQKEKRVGLLRDIMFFVLSHQRLPGKKKSASESKLSEWLQRFHNDNKNKRLQKFDIQKEYDVLSRYTNNRRKRHFSAVEIAEIFYILHGRFPSSKNDSEIENSAYELCDGFRLQSSEKAIQEKCNDTYLLFKK